MKILYPAYCRWFDRTQLESEIKKKKHFHCKINKQNEGMSAQKSIEVRTNHVAYQFMFTSHAIEVNIHAFNHCKPSINQVFQLLVTFLNVILVVRDILVQCNKSKSIYYVCKISLLLALVVQSLVSYISLILCFIVTHTLYCTLT